MGVQESGDFVLWSYEDSIIYEFEADTFPQDSLMEDEEEHLMAAAYSDIEAPVKELPEEYAKQISGGDETVEENMLYRDVTWEQLVEYAHREDRKDELADYPANLERSLESGHIVFDDNWKKVLE